MMRFCDHQDKDRTLRVIKFLCIIKETISLETCYVRIPNGKKLYEIRCDRGV